MEGEEHGKVTSNVVEECERFLGIAYRHTSYEEAVKESGKLLFQALLTKCCEQLETAPLQVIGKFEPLAISATQRVQYRALIKVAWRFVKGLRCSATEQRLFLIALAFSALTVGARSSISKPREAVRVDKWRDEVARWFGEQLTSGGKGVSGAGEGDAFDRASRFFSTPYLHDFD